MHELIEKIRHSVIGHRCSIPTVFGDRPLIYADYTASGRSLDFIEDYIRQQVLPWYGNTHTESSHTGARTTSLREWARNRIRAAVGGSKQDKVVFCGHGATAAVNRLIDVLELRARATSLPEEERPVVFIGPYEHHSNELPWRESCAELEVIPLDAEGGIDLRALEQALQKHAERSLLIGSFSAASNVTGIRSDVDAVSALLARYGALVCWDYAAAGPYVDINMNGSTPFDAVFLSPHKFVGGPGTPGVLVAKQSVFRNRIPAMVGGGTVSYVTPLDHQYVSDIERREEGGTPAIVESIRAGLVFDLQQRVGVEEIAQREALLASRAMERLSACPGIEILGDHDAVRLPIFSLRFRYQGRELHYGFIVALLNDLFGIQARGGCSCAGPYAHHLLGMDLTLSRRLERAVAEGQGILRPGWVRLGFNYFIDEDEFEYLLRALELVAEHGWQLLPDYVHDDARGVWVHQEKVAASDNASALLQPDYLGGAEAPVVYRDSLHDVLQEAERILLAAPGMDSVSDPELALEHEDLRWFLLPGEVSRPGISP